MKEPLITYFLITTQSICGSKSKLPIADTTQIHIHLIEIWNPADWILIYYIISNFIFFFHRRIAYVIHPHTHSGCPSVAIYCGWIFSVSHLWDDIIYILDERWKRLMIQRGGGGACLQSAYRLFRSICISSALTDRLPAATPCCTEPNRLDGNGCWPFRNRNENIIDLIAMHPICSSPSSKSIGRRRRKQFRTSGSDRNF
jgi:hypothetical protein